MALSDTTGRPRARRSAVRALRLAGVTLLGAGGLLLAASTPSGASTLGGTVTLVAGGQINAYQNKPPITSGSSDTIFGVELQRNPSGGFANCSADTATGSTTVHTYLIPANNNVNQLTGWATEPPTNPTDTNPNHGLALFASGGFETNTNDQNTAAGTAEIIIPGTLQFNFGGITDPANGLGVSKADLLSADNNTGQWVAGYACVKGVSNAVNPSGYVVTDYWQFPVTFTNDTSAAGGSQGFAWAVTGSATGGGTTTVPGPSTTAPGGAPTTAPTTPPSSASPPSSAPTDTSSAGGGTTGSTPPPAGSGGAGDTGGSNTGSGSGSAASSGSVPSGSGGSGTATLASTGSSARRDVSVAIALAMAGIALVLSSLLVPTRRPRAVRIR